MSWSRSAAVAAVLLVAPVVAWAQQTEAAFSRLAVGASNPSSDGPLTLGTLPPRSAGQGVLSVSVGGVVGSGALQTGDLPAAVPLRNVAETISSSWTFSGGITGPLDVSTSIASPIGMFSTRVRTPVVDTASGALTLEGASGVVEYGTNTTKVLPPASKTELGDLSRPWLSLDVLELHTRKLIADERIAFVGGSGMWARGTVLTRPAAGGDAVIYVQHNALRYHDYVVLRDVSSLGVPQYEVMRICSAAGVSQAEGDYLYCVERDRDGTGANSWPIGAAVVSTDRVLNVYSYSPTRLSYWGAVLADRPLLALNFMTSPAIDLMGSGAEATLGSGALHSALAAGGASVPGMFYRSGSAGALFTGLDPGTALNGIAGTCALSVELLVRIPDGGASGTQAYITYKGAPGSSANHFAILHTGDGRFYMLGAPGGTWGALTPQTPVFSTAQYVHLVFTWDSSAGGRVFVNGVQSGGELAAPGGCLTPNATAIVGNGQWVTGQSAGAGISELAIYGYVLAPAQIRAHHEARNVSRSSLTHGPTISGEERTSTSSWDAVATRWALGQLQGIASYTEPAFGLWAGDEAATWISADARYGFRIGHGSSIKLHATPNGDLDLAGNLSLLDGGDLRSVGNWSLTRTGGLMFEPSGSSINVARAIRWSSESSISQVVIDGAPRLQLVGSTSPGLQTMLRLGNGMAEFTAPFGVVPASDGLLPLGSATQRWANVNLALEANTSPAYVVVNKGGAGADANSALGYVVGYPTGGGSDTFFVLRNLSGDMCSLTFRAGLLMSTTC